MRSAGVESLGCAVRMATERRRRRRVNTPLPPRGACPAHRPATNAHTTAVRFPTAGPSGRRTSRVVTPFREHACSSPHRVRGHRVTNTPSPSSCSGDHVSCRVHRPTDVVVVVVAAAVTVGRYRYRRNDVLLVSTPCPVFAVRHRRIGVKRKKIFFFLKNIVIF